MLVWESVIHDVNSAPTPFARATRIARHAEWETLNEGILSRIRGAPERELTEFLEEELAAGD